MCIISHFTPVFHRCLLFFLVVMAVGCVTKRSLPDLSSVGENPADNATVVSTGARRADPGYLQYLERLSMLGSQAELARVVSGSQLAWLRQAGEPFPDPLLGLADTWLYINPLTLLPDPKKNLFSTVASPLYWQIFSKARINGIYFAPASGAGGLWAYNRKASVRGDDVIQYTFSEAAGPESDYLKVLSAANTNRKLLGLDLTPASTGLGPDFFLATRYHRQFSGMYCMVEIPTQAWPSLPAVSDQWRGVPLNDAQVASLAKNNLLPPAMVQDFSPFGKKTGWAVTGDILGVDGLARRWVYRYNGSADRPVLNWEDPSQNAHKVLSGSAIRSVGMLGGALVGIRLDGLYGLDAAQPGMNKRFSADPARSAAFSISREVRRYGGWSWLTDELPLATIRTLMPGGPDFFQDHVFSPGIEHAVLTGSTTLLKQMTDDALVLGLDMRRFVHATSAEGGVSYELPHLADIASDNGAVSTLKPSAAETLIKSTLNEAQNSIYAAKLNSARGEDVPPLKGKHLSTTSAGVAALALGAGNDASVTPDMHDRIRDGHLLQIFLRAMLPGVFMLSGQDVAGSLPLSWYSMADSSASWDSALASRGAYALTQAVPNTATTAQAVPKAKTIYPPADVQILTDDSFIAKLADILAIRASLRIADGRLHGRVLTAPGCYAMAVVLPRQGQSGQPGHEVWFDAPKSDAKNAASGAMRLTIAERRLRQHEENESKRRALGGRIIALPHSAKLAETGDAAIIAVVNFTQNPVVETLNFNHDPVLQRIREKGAPVLLNKSKKPGGSSGVSIRSGAKTITVTLPPWQGAVILIGKGPQ